MEQDAGSVARLVIMTAATLNTFGALVVALACIMQGEAAILGHDGAAIAGHVALNRYEAGWYDDIRTGWNGCLDGAPSIEYVLLAGQVISEHEPSDYVFWLSAKDCERLGMGESSWYYEREIGGRLWGGYAYTEEEWDYAKNAY